jgi:hypothetical protein
VLLGRLGGLFFRGHIWAVDITMCWWAASSSTLAYISQAQSTRCVLDSKASRNKVYVTRSVSTIDRWQRQQQPSSLQGCQHRGTTVIPVFPLLQQSKSATFLTPRLPTSWNDGDPCLPTTATKQVSNLRHSKAANIVERR